MILALLALALQATDVVTTRDGRRLEGRALEFGQIVEIELADGKRSRLYRHEVLRIDPGADVPRCPEVLPFPSDLLEKTEYEFASYRKTLLAVPKRGGGKLIAVDVAAGKRAWSLEVPDLLIPPVVAGSAVYLVTLTKELDESRKLKFGGTASPKEVHRIMVRVVDFETCETRWIQAFDNNDRRDVYWTVAANPAPTVHVLPDRVALRIAKDAWPVDKDGNCDKTKPLKYASFVSVDPVAKRLLGSVDSDDAAESGGRAWFTSELVVLQVFLNATSWKLVGIGAKDGKKRWESEPVTGTLHEITDESAYASDLTHFHAISMKTGKRQERPALELLGGRVAEVDGGFAYVYRAKKTPKQIEVFDLKRGAVSLKIPMIDAEELTHLKLVGNRLLYTDQINRIRGYDLTAKKEIWTWNGNGAGSGFIQSPNLLGGALSFYKDGRITLLDTLTGQKIWDVKGPYRSITQVGDEGFFAVRNPGLDLIRRRRFDREGVFFTPGGTPLRYAWGGEEAWAPPALVDGVLYTISSGGVALVHDMKQGKTLWSEKLTRQPVQPLSTPVVHDDRVLMAFGGEVHGLVASTRGRMYQVRHVPIAGERPFGEDGGLWFACAPGLPFSGIDFASGKRVWDSPARGVTHYAVGGGTIHAVSETQYMAIDPKTGAIKESTNVPRGTTSVAADEKRVVVLTGAYGFGRPGSEGIRPVWTARTADPKIGFRFKGALAFAPEGVVYAHADGAVAFIKDGAEKEAWDVSTPEFTSSLLVHEGRVWFAAAPMGLMGVDLKDGRVAWKSPLADAGAFTPILWEGKPAFWSSDGWLVPVRE